MASVTLICVPRLPNGCMRRRRSRSSAAHVQNRSRSEPSIALVRNRSGTRHASQSRSNPDVRQTLSGAGDSMPSEAPISPQASSPRSSRVAIFAVLAGTAAIVSAVVIGIDASDGSETAARTNYTSRTSTYTSTTSIYTPASTFVYTPAYTQTVPSTYLPPNAQSFDSVFQNAKVGECVNRGPGSSRSDGSKALVSFYLTDCGATDATDKVTMTGFDTDACSGGWARSDTPPNIVLCLRNL